MLAAMFSGRHHQPTGDKAAHDFIIIIIC